MPSQAHQLPLSVRSETSSSPWLKHHKEEDADGSCDGMGSDGIGLYKRCGCQNVALHDSPLFPISPHTQSSTKSARHLIVSMRCRRHFLMDKGGDAGRHFLMPIALILPLSASVCTYAV